MRLASLIGMGLLCASGALAQVEQPSNGVMIFFDWDKSTIGRDDAGKLDSFVANYLKQPGARILIESHSDRSGSAASNLTSSRLRADVVREQLIARGIPAAAIETIARGEGQPLIPTADGVREPQNRRVELRIGPV